MKKIVDEYYNRNEAHELGFWKNSILTLRFFDVDWKETILFESNLCEKTKTKAETNLLLFIYV